MVEFAIVKALKGRCRRSTVPHLIFKWYQTNVTSLADDHRLLTQPQMDTLKASSPLDDTHPSMTVGIIVYANSTSLGPTNGGSRLKTKSELIKEAKGVHEIWSISIGTSPVD